MNLNWLVDISMESVQAGGDSFPPKPSRDHDDPKHDDRKHDDRKHDDPKHDDPKHDDRKHDDHDDHKQHDDKPPKQPMTGKGEHKKGDM